MRETERLPCLVCDKTYLNADTVIAHYRRDHNAPKVDTTAAVYGPVCPECGRTFERLDQHASRTHGRPLPLLFADAHRAGDPRGVVAERRRLFVALSSTVTTHHWRAE